MADELNTQVPDASGEGVAQPATPNTPAEVTNVTPANASAVDVEKVKSEYEAQLAQSRKDMDRMKSSLQKQTAEVEKAWQKKFAELQNQFKQVQLSQMTDEERKQYEVQAQMEEFQSLQERLGQVEQERQSMSQMMDAMAFFLQRGVPAEQLNLNEGYDGLARSGWNYIDNELARLREAAKAPKGQTKTEPEPLPKAPDVLTDKSTPGKGTTWSELRKRFGSDEAVYRAVEEGRLDPSIIPTE